MQAQMLYKDECSAMGTIPATLKSFKFLIWMLLVTFQLDLLGRTTSHHSEGIVCVR